MKKVLKFILLLIMPAYLCAAFVYCDIRHSYSRCNGLDVRILDSTATCFLSAADIKELIKKSGLDPIGKRRVDVNEARIENCVKGNSVVECSECYISPSGKAYVDVSQRVPLLRVIANDTSYYIDKNGKIMPLSKWVVTYVPVATGYITPKYAMEQLFPFAKFLASGNKWENQIEQIYITPTQEIELIPRIGGQLIIFGKISNFEQKLNMLDILYSQSFAKTGWDTYDKINLIFDGRIICTRRQKDK
ncbi:MAG: hypothetical protein RR293_03190 [Bacteroidales bacterium]